MSIAGRSPSSLTRHLTSTRHASRGAGGIEVTAGRKVATAAEAAALRDRQQPIRPDRSEARSWASARASQCPWVAMAAIEKIWFTRCPVPTATGLAYKLGWLTEEFARDGIAVHTLQDAGAELARHHYDHALPTLIREGGNLLAIPAKAQGAPTRLVGLTWID